MRCPKCKTEPHSPIQIQRKGMCRMCVQDPNWLIKRKEKEGK